MMRKQIKWNFCKHFLTSLVVGSLLGFLFRSMVPNVISAISASFVKPSNEGPTDVFINYDHYSALLLAIFAIFAVFLSMYKPIKLLINKF